MPVYKIPKIGYLKYVMLITMMFFTACSIKDSLDGCPSPITGEENNIRQLLYLRVSDQTTRGDITNSEYLEDVMVYFFDQDKKLLDTLQYDMTLMRQGIPIDLTERNMNGGYVSVWANTGNSVGRSRLARGMDISDIEMSMIANDNRNDFFLCPGDMFFACDKVDLVKVDETTEADTVWLERKNARLNITVRGLTDNDDSNEYYFRIGSLYSAYDFEGIPKLEARHIWEEGYFNSRLDYISPEPYIMIHDAVNHIYNDTSKVTVELYKTDSTRAGDMLIASGDRDVYGEYIKLERNKTTNVLIVLDEETGEVSIQMIITPWEVIHQWTIW